MRSVYLQTSAPLLLYAGGVLAAPDTAYNVTPSANLAQESVSSEFGKPSYAGTYGFDFGNGFRTGLETVRSGTAPPLFTPVQLDANRVMLNGFYEFSDDGWRMRPYVGAGFGLSDVTETVLGTNTSAWVHTYQVRGGIKIDLAQKLLGSLEYRWTSGTMPQFLLGGIPAKFEVDRHGFSIGVNYKY